MVKDERSTHIRVHESSKKKLVDLAENLECSVAQAIDNLLQREDVKSLVTLGVEEKRMVQEKAEEWKTTRSKALSMMIQKQYQQDNIKYDNINVKMDYLIEYIRSLEEKIDERR